MTYKEEEKKPYNQNQPKTYTPLGIKRLRYQNIYFNWIWHVAKEHRMTEHFGSKIEVTETSREYLPEENHDGWEKK